MLTTIFVFFLALAAGVPMALCRQPNIVLIMTDDQGYGDLGVTGNPVLDTPHIDRLAREGGTMATFYVSPVCSPTRASLLTGRYNYRTRITDTFKGRSMMAPEETTLAEALRTGGYRTGIFGKWHLGDNHPLRPSDQGFDESLIHRGGGLGQPSEPFENKRRYTDAILFRNDVQTQTRGYCTDVFFDAALEFIDSARANDRPFFAYIAPNAPHSPYHDVPEDLFRKYAAKDLSKVLLGASGDADTVARVFAMVENIDTNVGRLLTHLERRAIAANTIVIFMTDNGPNTRRYVSGLRGMKSEVYEGGIRSPFFLRWPQRVRAGSGSDRIAAHIDVMPTLLAAAGLPAPADVRLDGRNFLPLLEGNPVDWPDRHLVLQAHRGDAPVAFHNAAIRNQRWKLLRASGSGRETLPPNAVFELYDLAADPGEQNDRAKEHPELVRQLEQAYARWFEDVSTTRPDNFAPPRIAVGTPHEFETVMTSQDKRVRENGWLLRVDRAGPYTVELRWKDRAASAGAVEVRIGAETRRVKVGPGESSVRIPSLNFPEGEAVLVAQAVDSPGLDDPPHVALRPLGQHP